jgi:hypothetical protein
VSDRYVAGFGALEDSVNENRRVAQKLCNTGAARDEAAGGCRFLEWSYHREPVLKGEVREL